MATTQKQRDAVLREKNMKKALAMFTGEGSFDDVGRTGSGTFMYPDVDDEGNERFVEITVKIPTARTGEAYDGYAEVERYKQELEIAAQKKVTAEAEKAKKIARDEANRAAKKAAKVAAEGE